VSGRDHSIECHWCGLSYGGLNGPDVCPCNAPDGSFERPFRTIERAKAAFRAEASFAAERDALRVRVATLEAALRTAHDYMREQAEQCCAWTVAVGCHECAWMRGVVRRLDAALTPPAGREPSGCRFQGCRFQADHDGHHELTPAGREEACSRCAGSMEYHTCGRDPHDIFPAGREVKPFDVAKAEGVKLARRVLTEALEKLP
jgi:hypothetical protein